ncbi:MAG: allantoicase [Flavobacterium sp.]|jgi:allantoicase
MATEDFIQRSVDLAAERLGGETLDCSDDFFAEMENLLKPGRGIFIEDKYTERGKWMDGWESRRSYGRENGRDSDWCTIALGVPGKILGFDIDTNHFRGNSPQMVSIEACQSKDRPASDQVWTLILPKVEVNAHSQNIFELDDKSDQIWTHLRLTMFPDGGIARLRVYGYPIADPDQFLPGELMDLAAIKNGGMAIRCSDMFFSDKNNLLMPGRGTNMGDGWETKRRRDPGPDWSIIKLAFKGSIRKVLIDTAHFKGNYPDRFSLQGFKGSDDEALAIGAQWVDLVAETKLQANHEHIFIDAVVNTASSFTHVRLNIFPDGGVSRMRIMGYKVDHED